MTKVLTHAQFIRLLKTQQGAMTQKEFALKLGISAAYLSDIYAGKREPGAAVLEKVGYERHPCYMPTEKTA